MSELSESPRRILFVKERMAWPRSSGHDVHTFHMMQALAARGHSIALASMAALQREAIANAGLQAEYCFEERESTSLENATAPSQLSKQQEKFRNYWGVEQDRMQWVGAVAADFQAEIVVVSGLNVLPYLGCLPKETWKVWYAADEWVWHHLSQVRLFDKSTWSEIKPAIIKGLYQRAYRTMLDRVWVVSPADARAFRWLSGISQTDVIPNGVDAEHYHPGDEDTLPKSCVFWGRLDFGPNIQALEWFCKKVWPRVLLRVPRARFQIFGFQPTDAVRLLVGQDGIELIADEPDIRTAVRSNQVVVLPFVSGGGIKNKLLEAAALGMPVIATPRVVSGLNGKPPFPKLSHVDEWVDKLIQLWTQPQARERLGRKAREWVVEHHSWTAAAEIAERSFGAHAPVRIDARNESMTSSSN